MSVVCVIGSATMRIIGLGPMGFETSTEATWADEAVFDDGPFYQPTAKGAKTMTVRLATRPHTHGGLDQYAILASHCENRDVVLFMRMSAVASGLPVGEVLGNVFVQSLSANEEKIAPDGVGWRFECDAELVFCGDMARD